MKVRELIEKLQAANPEAVVCVAVEWAADTAEADVDDDVTLETRASDTDQPELWLRGWLSNCDTSLEILEDES